MKQSHTRPASWSTLLLTGLLPLVLSACAGSMNVQPTDSPPPVSSAPGEALPMDPAVVTGTLSNGLQYFIQRNTSPENRAELRLVVNAGSVLEDKDQQGLAHVLEHMAFCGSEHFHKQELIDTLESLGMRFGADINASTGFDETVFKLQLPTDNVKALDTGFQIMEDWAHGLTLDDHEIDRERKVVIEEWRLGRGADARIEGEQGPILFHDSRYAERAPIGKVSILESFNHDALRRFYKDWYRPDLMAVVAVGDFQPDQVKQLIEAHFNAIPAPRNPRPRPSFKIPDDAVTRYSISSDPETSESEVDVFYERPARPDLTVHDFQRFVTRTLYRRMLNDRLSELTRKPDPPFLSASTKSGRLVRPCDYSLLSATVKDDRIAQGLEALLTEVERVRQHGFTAAELERQKKALLRSVELAHRDKTKLESSDLASELANSYLRGEPTPGTDKEYELYQRYVPEISLSDVNALSRDWVNEKNRFVLVTAPKKKGVNLPTQKQLAAVMQKVPGKPVSDYVEEAVGALTVSPAPKPSPIVKEEHLQELGLIRWTLQNGVHVILKPTTFRKDEVLFTAFSPGGTSLVPNADLVDAQSAPEIVSACGIGPFSENQLEKVLCDKEVSVTPYIDSVSEGFSGDSAPEDLETLLKLVYLYFTAPRKDDKAFAAYKDKIRCSCDNRDASPEELFQDTITETLTQNHPRYKPLTPEKVDRMDLDKAFEIYGKRFSNAGDFTFIFVGSIDPARMKPLVETYLGGLPSSSSKESWKDETYEFPKGVVEKDIRKGCEPKSLNSIIFTGPFDWSRKNRYLAGTMVDVLRIDLRERIRHQLAGTYGVDVDETFSHFPKQRYKIEITFGSDPSRVQELTAAVFEQVEALKAHGPSAETLAKVKEADLREYETNLRDNGYWLSALEAAYFHGEDPASILRYRQLIQDVTLQDVQKAAQLYLDEKNYVKVVLYPEKQNVKGQKPEESDQKADVRS